MCCPVVFFLFCFALSCTEKVMFSGRRAWMGGRFGEEGSKQHWKPALTWRHLKTVGHGRTQRPLSKETGFPMNHQDAISLRSQRRFLSAEWTGPSGWSSRKTCPSHERPFPNPLIPPSSLPENRGVQHLPKDVWGSSQSWYSNASHVCCKKVAC